MTLIKNLSIAVKVLKVKGFTLIEVLIAVFILTVGIVGVMGMFPMGVQVVKSTQIVSVASHLASAKIEEMLSKSYSDPILEIGTMVEEYGDLSDFQAFKRITKVACVSPVDLLETSCDTGLKKVEVTIFWKSPLGTTEKNIKFASLITKR